MLQVRDIMTTEVVTLDPELALREAVEILVEHHIGGAPVVAGHRVLGVVSATDVLAFAASTPGVPTERPAAEEDVWEPAAEWVEGEEAPGAFFNAWWEDAAGETTERFAAVASPQWDLLGERVVSDVMSTVLCSIRPDADVADAAHYLIRAGVHRLLVLDGSRLLGVVTATDVVRAVASGLPVTPGARTASP
jgi:CBS domain-containing protein